MDMGTVPSLDFLIENFARPSVAADLWRRTLVGPWDAIGKFYADFGKNLDVQFLLNSLKAREESFVVTRELNHAMYGAIRDANAIHHDERNPIVGYGTILGFEFLLLRSQLPAEQLISLNADYKEKMMEGNRIFVRYREAKVLENGDIYLKGVASRDREGKDVVATYQYTLRFVDGKNNFPVVTKVKAPPSVQGINIPFYSENELRQRVGLVKSSTLEVDYDSLEREATVFNVLSGGRLSELEQVWGKRDLRELYVAGEISDGMATLGGKGTLFKGLNIRFVDPVRSDDSLSSALKMTDVAVSGDRMNYKLYFTGETHKQDGQVIAKYAPFGLRPINAQLQ